MLRDKQFIRRSEIPSGDRYLYREAKRNLGHSGHQYLQDGSLPEPEPYDPFMTLKEED